MDDATLVIRLEDETAGPAELESAALVLRRDLIVLDIDDIQKVTGEAHPVGTRSAEAAAVAGALVLTLRSSTSLIKQVLGAVRWWIQGGVADRTAEIVIGEHSLRLSGVTSEQQDRLIDVFVQAVSDGKS